MRPYACTHAHAWGRAGACEWLSLKPLPTLATTADPYCERIHGVARVLKTLAKTLATQGEPLPLRRQVVSFTISRHFVSWMEKSSELPSHGT